MKSEVCKTLFGEASHMNGVCVLKKGKGIRHFNHNALHHCGAPQLGLQCHSIHPPRVIVPFHIPEGASHKGRQFFLPALSPLFTLPVFVAIANPLVVILIINNSTIALFFQFIFLKSLATPVQPTCGHQIHFYETSLHRCLFFNSDAFSKGSALSTMPDFLFLVSKFP